MERAETIRRQRLVRELRQQGIADPRVLEAMGSIPREKFVEEALEGAAYDGALPIGQRQTISQPRIVARMCELAEPDGYGRALEVGSGSGYHAAVLARLFELVYSVERIPELAELARRTVRGLGWENVHFKIFDGGYGWSEFAPYRAILVTAAAPRVPTPLVEQLEDGGRLILPIAEGGVGGEQLLTRVTKAGGELRTESFESCRFVPLLGRFGWSK